MTRVNLRGGVPSGRFGTADDENAYLDKCRRITKTMTVQFQVAPGAVVTAPSGKVLRAGDEVTASMLSGAERAPLTLIREWVDQGKVLEADGFSDGPEAA